jgi:hypothetical protein
MVRTRCDRRAVSGRAAVIAGAGADGVEIRRELFSAKSCWRCPRWAIH